MDGKIGYAVCFENMIFYVDRFSDLIRTIGKKKTGQYLGTVHGIIPADPYRVCYEWIKHTKGFKQRKQERKILKKLGLSRSKMKYLKQKNLCGLRGKQAEIKKWL